MSIAVAQTGHGNSLPIRFPLSELEASNVTLTLAKSCFFAIAALLAFPSIQLQEEKSKGFNFCGFQGGNWQARSYSNVMAHLDKCDGLNYSFFGRHTNAPAAGSGCFDSSCRTTQPYDRSVGCRVDLGDWTQPSYPAVMLAVPIPWWKPPEPLVQFLFTLGSGTLSSRVDSEKWRCFIVVD